MERIISICGIFYRPAIRATGAGWATSMAKFGAADGALHVPVPAAVVR